MNHKIILYTCFGAIALYFLAMVGILLTVAPTLF
jgi:hypothetical protein